MRHSIAATALVALVAAGAPALSPAAAGAPAAPAQTRAVPRAPWPSGIAISRPGTKATGLGYACTAGIPARKGNRNFLVTAGHCGTYGETISTGWVNGKRRAIGTIAGYSKLYDIAAIETSGKVQPAYWGNADPVLKPLRGVATVRRGSKVCHNGYRSGTVCDITVLGSTKNASGTVTLVYGSAESTTARPGDSGALVTDTRGRAVGVVSSISPDGQNIAWVPAGTALATWGMTAVTE